ncbi:hypothetical protein [Selenomonas sp.]|uniref:hypothetical protein n=1 Tax=Selenomonas sp. TaxID=2053611 RepID=UPI0025FC8521|nr:hypothetical protein [Selenomonas sp.]MCI6085173.1 hypothetical protein [Selenomonas sp.]MDY3296252.1 hypothetical protein [Selenomonas sp.]
MFKKVFTRCFMLCALVMTFAFAAMPSAEAGVVSVPGHSDWLLNINDSSVYMVGRNHAHVIISVRSSEGEWSRPYPVHIRWGAGFECYRISQSCAQTGTVNSDVGLAVANYMSENY